MEMKALMKHWSHHWETMCLRMTSLKVRQSPSEADGIFAVYPWYWRWRNETRKGPWMERKRLADEQKTSLPLSRRKWGLWRILETRYGPKWCTTLLICTLAPLPNPALSLFTTCMTLFWVVFQLSIDTCLASWALWKRNGWGKGSKPIMLNLIRMKISQRPFSHPWCPKPSCLLVSEGGRHSCRSEDVLVCMPGCNSKWPGCRL